MSLFFLFDYFQLHITNTQNRLEKCDLWLNLIDPLQFHIENHDHLCAELRKTLVEGGERVCKKLVPTEEIIDSDTPYSSLYFSSDMYRGNILFFSFYLTSDLSVDITFKLLKFKNARFR